MRGRGLRVSRRDRARRYDGRTEPARTSLAAKLRWWYSKAGLTLRFRISLFMLTIGASWMLGQQVAVADSQTLMNKLLDAYINVTPAEVYDTQRRGGITLGSVETRSRVIKPNLISLVPPSVHGGCGGVDLVGGSFSLVNSQQLEQFLRSIAANALNYAFTLALEGVCPTCEQKIEKLKDWVNDMNRNMLDSCHAATQLVNATGLNEWAQSRMQTAQNRDVQTGTATDIFSATTNFVSELVDDTTAGQSTATNAVWEALQKSQAATWFGSLGDNDLKEVILSVTGTLVKSPVDGGGAACQNTDSAKEYCYTEFMPLLTVEHFVDGSDAGPVNIYSCASDAANCLNPKSVQRDWPGLKRRVREILFGPSPGFTGGLIYKLRDPAATFTPTEQGFIQGAPLPVLTLLKNVAQYPGSLVSMGEQLQNLITVEIARDVVLEMITVVQHSFGAQNVQMSAMMHDRLRDRVQEFQARISYEDRDFKSMLDLLQAMDQIGRLAREQAPPSAPASPIARNRS
jgi:conjugative transfer pilus assembly protein TraH